MTSGWINFLIEKEKSFKGQFKAIFCVEDAFNIPPLLETVSYLIVVNPSNSSSVCELHESW